MSQHRAVEVAGLARGRVRLRIFNPKVIFTLAVNMTQTLNIIQAKALHTDATANRARALVERDEGRVAGSEECSSLTEPGL
jgi:hypothetical protein